MLISEDEYLVRHFTELVGERGYGVRPASTTDAAISVASASRPDVIVVDSRAPREGATAWVENLRAQSEFSDVPVMILGDPESGKAPRHAPGVVWLDIPLDEDRLIAALRRAVRTPGQARALLVEDDPGIRMVVQAQLEQLGLDCTTANDGVRAVELADEVDPDLIVLDLSLPRLNGFEVVETLKHHKTRNVALLVYSGHELTDDDRGALELGATKHLMKARSTEEEFTDAVKDLVGAAIENWQGREAGE